MQITNEVLALIGTIVVAICGVLGTLVGKRKTRTERDAQVVDNFQNLVTAYKDELDRLQTNYQNLEKKIEATRVDKEEWRDYANQLRRHITNELPPPPPSVPKRFRDKE